MESWGLATLPTFGSGIVLGMPGGGSMLIMPVLLHVAQRPPPRKRLQHRSSRSASEQPWAVGLMTGMVGAGGGFAVVPALVIFGGDAIEKAIGTSLMVIAAQSLAGVAGHLGNTPMDWRLVVAVSAASILGSAAGARLAGRIQPQWLRRGFAVLAVAVAIPLLAGRWFSRAEAAEAGSQATTIKSATTND